MKKRSSVMMSAGYRFMRHMSSLMSMTFVGPLFFNKYKKGKTSVDWELYRKQRKYVPN